MNAIFGMIFLAGPFVSVLAFAVFDKRSRSTRATKLRRLSLGFSVALLASLSWGIGNYLTGYTARSYGSSATLDIALANYASGCLAIGAVAVASALQRRTLGQTMGAAKRLISRRLVIAAAFKGLNTYLFCASVAFISSAIAATVENLYLVWVGLIAAISLRSMPRLSWITSTLIVLGAVSLILYPDYSNAQVDLFGAVLALLAGVAFAVFLLLWANSSESVTPFEARAFQTSAFLALSAVMIMFAHVTLGWVLFSHVSTLGTLSLTHLFLQLGNGVVNIGITYFLAAEALRILWSLGRWASLVVGIGLSYAVFFTFSLEVIVDGRSIQFIQWCGMILFTIGIAAVRALQQKDEVELQNVCDN